MSSESKTSKMVKDGQSTLSATEFARLTGVSRERLRTWERRHRFPQPLRAGGTARRRYATSDIKTVIAVREMSERGVPLNEAISEANQSKQRDKMRPIIDLANISEELPLPLVLVSGPVPLQVEYVNTIARSRPDHLKPGDLLLETEPDFAGSPAHNALIEIFAGSMEPVEREHPSLDRGHEGTVRSVIFPAGQKEPGVPLAGLLNVETERERSEQRALTRLNDEYARLERIAERDSMVLASVTELSQKLRDEEQPAAIIRSATDAIIRHLEALDAGVALYMAGELLLGTSSKGLLGPAMVVVSGREDLSRVMRTSKRVTLQRTTARAFGSPKDTVLVALPVTVTGESVAALMIAFDSQPSIDSLQQQFIDIATSIIGFALLRDRFTNIAEEEDEDLER